MSPPCTAATTSAFRRGTQRFVSDGGRSTIESGRPPGPVTMLVNLVASRAIATSDLVCRSDKWNVGIQLQHTRGSLQMPLKKGKQVRANAADRIGLSAEIAYLCSCVRWPDGRWPPQGGWRKVRAPRKHGDG